VRLTGSGLGCPSWPQCVPGSYTPVLRQPEGWHKYVEFGNRLMSPVLSVVAVACLVAVVAYLRAHPTPAYRRSLLILGAVPLAGVLAQALIGGWIVVAELNPTVVAFHFLLSMALVAGSTMLARRVYTVTASPGAAPGAAPGTAPDPAVDPAGDPAGDPAVARALGVRPEVRWLALAVGIAAAVVLTLGTVVTGSGPHSGDADTPNRFGFDPRTVSWLHADAVWLFVGLVVGLAFALRLVSGPAAARRWMRALLVVTLAQGAIGYVQYLTDLPVALVAAHMLGASLLVIATTGTVDATLERSAPSA